MNSSLCIRFILVMSVVLLLACGTTTSRNEAVDDKRPVVVVTTNLLADAVQRIVKDTVRVEALMGAGVDPHLYKASIGDLRTLLDADFVFYQGLHLEGKLGEVLDKLGRTKNVIALADQVATTKIRYVDANRSVPDPHIWFDVQIWKEVVEMTCLKLSEELPSYARFFRENTNEYLIELDQLDQYIHQQISTVSREKRVLITSHDAFNYFGSAYDIEVRGLQGISTLSDFGLKDISDLVKLILDRNIPAVFVETSVSSRSLEAVAAGVQERGGNLHIGGMLYTDALGETGTKTASYIGMMKYNVETIVNGLK